MRFTRYLLPALAILVTACGVESDPVVNSRPPLALVKYIHAIPDEGPVDIRMIDQTKWSAYALNTNFRQQSIPMPTQAGNRLIRVWRATNVLDEIELLIEQNVQINAGENVTLLLTGSVQAGTARIEVIRDDVPDSVANQIHVRAVNTTGTAATVSWVDGNGASAPTNVASLGTTNYVARPLGAVTASFDLGGDTYEAAAPAGAPQDGLIGATAGHQASGSALAAYLFPASVPDSRAPQTAAYQQPAVIWFVDRVPAPPR